MTETIWLAVQALGPLRNAARNSMLAYLWECDANIVGLGLLLGCIPGARRTACSWASPRCRCKPGRSFSAYRLPQALLAGCGHGVCPVMGQHPRLMCQNNAFLA